jgi:adenylate cyclase
MPSIIEGYTYDIFISYRQNDNKYDGWVTEFVDNLNKELDANIKDKVSVYFDINPTDGLLETDSVDKSLEGKLKCLIFIPIISRTYCDPKSFAWQHEFCAFNKLAKEDKYGRDIKLASGNVASRILPVKIHDLDSEDTELLENELGEVLRGIELIYKEPGVNRPLKPDDDPRENINKTNYRNQINKVANAIKEIIQGLRKEPLASGIVQVESVSTSEKQTIQEKSIVVLPFTNMSADPEQEYFCDGITEEIINALANVGNLKVIARTSSFAFKDRYEDIREIGRKLDVETIVEGSIRKAGNRIRVTAQLIKVADGSHLWSEAYNREMKDVFAIQEEISQAIVDNLKVKLIAEESLEMLKRHTENLEAYNLYLKGNYYCQMMTAEGFKKAFEQFEQALQKDPNYALAYTGLGSIYVASSYFGNMRPKEAYPKAIEFLNMALKIDNTNTEALIILGFINFNYYWNWKKAEIYFKQALQKNPNSSMGHLYYSMFLTCIGRHEEAISEAKKAQELDPLSLYTNAHVSLILCWARHFDEAIEVAQMTISMNPNYYISHRMLAIAYWAKSMNKEAVAEFKKVVDLSGGIPYYLAELAARYYEFGKHDETEKLYVSLKKRSEHEYVIPMSFYLIHKIRCEFDLAYDWLERAINERDSMVLWFLPIPMKNVNILEEPRFNRLLKKAGLGK